MTRPDIFIVAAEPSGDHLGSELALSLQSIVPNIELAAIGGDAFAKAGLKTRMDTGGLAILGFVEGLKALPFVLRKVKEAVSIILEANPKSVVLIDSWGFMVRVAKALKKAGYKGLIVKYVAPQVWAMRSGRAKVLARYVDHLLSTQTMDEPYFRKAGLSQTFVGNPVLDQDYQSGNEADFLKRHDLDSSKLVIGFFFGSRRAEIERISHAILKASDLLQSWDSEIQPVYLVAEPVKSLVEPLLDSRSGVVASQSELIDAMSAMDGAVAVSGTITTQLAASGVPTVVLYSLSPLTYFLASRLFKPRFISLVNISHDQAGERVPPPLMPEFLQDEIMTEAPAKALLEIISNPEKSKAVREALVKETQRMGAGSEQASDRAAKTLLSLLD